ncbi:transcription initiation factor TFIID subunit 2-like isoform X2 [Corticium candelabrum]|uniref:transcription initiation factor TFIID subunit 2-like isoform X2 n=1 Tax=Corticium candelabrum TaxID=121492 RepID=UPI002E26A869|nr:transcription initiation factor TFIID subunit 2-like isoform X2 [Corticium candelabrum]
MFRTEKRSRKCNEWQRQFRLIHQKLCISHVNFQKKAIAGFTELSLLAINSTLSVVHLNSRKLRITGIGACCNDKQFDVQCELQDPLDSVYSRDNEKRSLDYYTACYKTTLNSVDADVGMGELFVYLPGALQEEIQCSESGMFTLKVMFLTEQSSGGLHFVATEGNDGSHMFVSGGAANSRLCFPCLDSYFELCTWELEFTVNSDMVAVSSGDLIETVMKEDQSKKTFCFSLDVPTAAPRIGFVVGPFEILPNPAVPEITHFCLPGLMPLLEDTTAFFKDVYGYFEDVLSTRFPYSSYKHVFVDEAFDEAQSYASLTILNTNLLHSSRIIDQAFKTRRVLAKSLAEQYFTCYLSWETWNDWWLPTGINGYLYGLYIQKAFGHNEYNFWLREQLAAISKAERQPPGLPPLHTKSLTKGASVDPMMSSLEHIHALASRSHFVMRLLAVKIGHDFLLQIFNKLLSLASNVVQQSKDNDWDSLLVSTQGFIKMLSTVSGKDLQVFFDQWVYRSGYARFSCQFVFNRKRNIIEIELHQDVPSGSQKFVGPLTVCIQELDGSFKHVIQIEDTQSRHEIACHSKSRRNKKKKIPLHSGEEVDMDLSLTDTDSPVLWVRFDPDLHWLREFHIQQPDYMWQLQLKYERDINAQLDALENYPSTSARTCLADIISDSHCFFRVRTQAIHCMAKCITACSSTWGVPFILISIHRNLFGSYSCPTIVKLNDFSDFAMYLIQKEFPIAIAKIRSQHKQSPRDVLVFLQDLIKYNDNRINSYSDCYYVSSLVDALSLVITPAVAIAGTPSKPEISNLSAGSADAQIVAKEVVELLNLEKLLPSYRNCVTVSCLKAIRKLQKNGHLPAKSQVFHLHAQVGLFEDVRCAALECLVDFVRVEKSAKELLSLLEICKNDPVPYIRYYVLKLLAAYPPFRRKDQSPLNTQELVHKLWDLMGVASSVDTRIRVTAIELYSTLYGKLTPSCMPDQGLGVVIDLKARQAVTRKSTAQTPDAAAHLKSIAPKAMKPTQSATPPKSQASLFGTVSSAGATEQRPPMRPVSPRKAPAAVKSHPIPKKQSVSPVQSLHRPIIPQPAVPQPTSIATPVKPPNNPAPVISTNTSTSSITTVPVLPPAKPPVLPPVKQHKHKHKHKKRSHHEAFGGSKPPEMKSAPSVISQTIAVPSTLTGPIAAALPQSVLSGMTVSAAASVEQPKKKHKHGKHKEKKEGKEHKRKKHRHKKGDATKAEAGLPAMLPP